MNQKGKKQNMKCCHCNLNLHPIYHKLVIQGKKQYRYHADCYFEDIYPLLLEANLINNFSFPAAVPSMQKKKGDRLKLSAVTIGERISWNLRQALRGNNKYNF